MEISDDEENDRERIKEGLFGHVVVNFLCCPIYFYNMTTKINLRMRSSMREHREKIGKTAMKIITTPAANRKFQVCLYSL